LIGAGIYDAAALFILYSLHNHRAAYFFALCAAIIEVTVVIAMLHLAGSFSIEVGFERVGAKPERAKPEPRDYFDTKRQEYVEAEGDDDETKEWL
jgi:hypothetical protein